LRTDEAVEGIVRAVVGTAKNGLRVSVAAVDGNVVAYWGTVPVETLYAASPEARTAVAFTASYDRPGVNVVLHANLSKGLLIIASMARFLDGREGVFAREFFRRVEGSTTHSEA